MRQQKFGADVGFNASSLFKGPHDEYENLHPSLPASSSLDPGHFTIFCRRNRLCRSAHKQIK